MAASLDVESFASYSDALQAAALGTTRLAALSLPADLAFHRSIDPVLAHDVDVFSDRILSLANRLVRISSANTRIQEEEDVVDEFIRNVVDPMEGMLESTDGALDVFLGKRKEPAIPILATPVYPPQNSSKKQLFRGRLDPALTHASHIPKPQLSFKHAPSNVDESPYIPTSLMPHKWCAKVPLGYVFHDDRPNQGIEDVLEYNDDDEGIKRSLHPYYYELTHPSYPDHVFNPPVEPSLPPSIDSSSLGMTTPHSLTLISTPKALLSMAKTISSSTELAVDLEHHSYRSFKGFLALMQISTRQGDFVIDLLAPAVREGFRQAKDKSIGENEEARIANEAGSIFARIFADPSVVKVFHGAESDIVWLQQDFNIFVVGLFDTFHASKVLDFPKHSLAYLLETYCDFIPDKRYQLADWRIRPLPTEMLHYARSDTHFLLYIYDMLRLSLIKRSSTSPATSSENRSLKDTKQLHDGPDLIHSVLARSSRTALRLYETEVYDVEGGTGSSGWDTLARKWNKLALVAPPSQRRGIEVQGSQLAVYRAVHKWREETAREEDESTRYVLPAHLVFLLAENAPTTISDLLSLFGGHGGLNGTVPPVLKRRMAELAAIMKDVLKATGPGSSIQEPAIEAVAPAAVNDSETMYSIPSLSSAKPTNESRLWNGSPVSTSAATLSVSHSSLFGTRIFGEGALEGGVTLASLVTGEETSPATSSAFGSALFKTSVSPFSMTKSTSTYARVSNEPAKRFGDILERIHKTLFISPVVSTPSVRTQALETSHPSDPLNAETSRSTSTMPQVTDPIPPVPESQIEVPFVPAHKRQVPSNPQNQKDDTIVVVGRAGPKQQKRKREKFKGIVPISQVNLVAGLGSTGIPSSTSDHDREIEEFDYSSIPNLLDSQGEHTDTRGLHEEDERKRKKQRHGKGSGPYEYGNFRALPRDQREVKSGNKTHTFR